MLLPTEPSLQAVQFVLIRLFLTQVAIYNLCSLNFKPYCVSEPLMKLLKHQKGGDFGLSTEQQDVALAGRWVSGLEAEKG